MIPVPKIRMFGFGSLTSTKEVAERLGPDLKLMPAGLFGYQRAFRAITRTHLYLTLQPAELSFVATGVAIEVDPVAFGTASQYEPRMHGTRPGYKIVDVTDHVVTQLDPPLRTYAFIAPSACDDEIHQICRERGIPVQVRRSYLEKCLYGTTKDDRFVWLAETSFPEDWSVDEDVDGLPPFDFGLDS